MIPIITHCPSCNHLLERVTDQLYCRNSDCPSQSLKRIEHFSKMLKIKGLGIKTIEALELEDISDIYTLSSEVIINCIGAALGAKLVTEIEKSKTAEISSVIAGFSIPAIGEGSAQKLTSIKTNFWDLTAAECRSAGLGEVATGKLITWIAENKNYKNLPFDFYLGKTITPTTRGVVVITGKLNDFKNRSEAKTFLESFGYKVVDSVTKTVNFLVNEAGEVSSKTDKAASYGIPIVTIKELTKEK